MRIDGDVRRGDGAVVRRAVPSRRAHVELAREAIDANLADLSPLAKRASVVR